VSNQYFSSLYCKNGHLLLGDNIRRTAFTIARNMRQCKLCWSAYMKKLRNNNLEKFRAKEKRITTNRCQRYKQMIFEAYGRVCECCGETHEAFLTLHHKKDNGAEHRRLRRGAKLWYLDVIRAGFPKDEYGLLCMNCNYARRWGKQCPHELERRQSQIAAD